ncbi:MAG: bifunctional DNA-formamidopyrimidine glycosylase/DNA-(apurinic or apyrimidinic site) lyase [Deltaproteobacteria bacterium]|nr:bifunctional DNA-formamidopyrimidine glycosylase/DNA-(apurinic or apyrimidinic site) lyase [Deltaproteobacteria bacterium]
MPELPEVESVRTQLSKKITPRLKVREVLFFRKDLRFPISVKVKSTMNSRERLGPLLGIERRAKYLLFKFQSGYFLSHLGMTGSWREVAPDEPRGLHDHILIHFENETAWMYNDPRRFGYVDWVEDLTEHPLLKHLAPEPLNPEFSKSYLVDTCRRKKVSIKSLIMDQRRVVGVGNIYASEALFRAGIRPTRMAGRIRPNELERLVQSIKQVLSEAIEHGGSTVKDFKGADGYAGRFQSRLFVYDRAGGNCRKCESKIVSKQLGGRSTYWCPVCQPSTGLTSNRDSEK